MNLVQKKLRGKTIVPSVNSAVLLALYGDLEDLFGGDLEGLFGVTFLERKATLNQETDAVTLTDAIK